MRPSAIVLLGILAALTASACEDGAVAPAAPASTAAVARLPECVPPSPPPLARPDVPLLPGTVVLTATDTGTVRQTNGWIARDPRDVRAGYESLPRLTLVASEDEGVEAELLLSAGDRRVYVKANSVCEGGSLLEIWSSPDSGEVPTLRGGG